MSRIKKNAWFGGYEVRVRQKDMMFRYVKPSPEELKHKGKKLEITLRSRYGESVISLNGTRINTLKKILKAAEEI